MKKDIKVQLQATSFIHYDLEDPFGARKWTGQVFPKFALKDIHGCDYTTDSLKGKPCFIYMWKISTLTSEFISTFRDFVPFLNKLSETYASKGVTFLAPTKDETNEVLQFLADQEFNFNVCPEAHALYEALELESNPRYIVVDGQGRIVTYAAHQETPPLSLDPTDGNYLVLALEEALAQNQENQS